MKRGMTEQKGWRRGGGQMESVLLVEASRSVLVVGVQEHLQGVVLDVGVAHHLLTDGVVVSQFLLHLENKAALVSGCSVAAIFTLRPGCSSTPLTVPALTSASHTVKAANCCCRVSEEQLILDMCLLR